MKKVNRYSFWKVFWVVLALYIIMIMLAVIAIALNPASASHKNLNWETICTWQGILEQCLKFLFSVGFYYYAINSYYRMIAGRKNAWPYIRFSAIAFLVFAAIFIFSVLFNDRKELEANHITTSLLVFSFTLTTCFNIGLSMLIAYLTYLRDERKQRKILEAQKMQLEVEKSQANFNFLKAQINPHFLHNTLNFLYAKSLPYSPELSEGILTLSDIMRYALSEGNAKDGKAPLKDEIEHVRNVIKINQLRFSNTLNVQFEVEGVINGAQIIPFVLITLVENAFKHGDLKSTDDPIIIKLKVSDHKLKGANAMQLYFYCRNRKKTGSKELSTGIGLENIKKRLDLAYGSDYVFYVNDEEEYYTTELTINKL